MAGGLLMGAAGAFRWCATDAPLGQMKAAKPKPTV